MIIKIKYSTKHKRLNGRGVKNCLVGRAAKEEMMKSHLPNKVEILSKLSLSNSFVGIIKSNHLPV